MNPDSLFASWLLRPYLDLGPARRGPLHARNVVECWRSFDNPDVARYVPQRALAPGFREELLRVLGDARYCVSDPRMLPFELRTAEWRCLCESIDRWEELRHESRVRLLVLLHTLGFYSVASGLVPAAEGGAWARDPGAAELQFFAAASRFMLEVPSRADRARGPDMKTFERLALDGPPCARLRVDSAIKMLVHKAKTGRPVQELQEWAAVLETVFRDALDALSGFEAGLLTSRYYRAIGFLPQHRGDRAELGRVMDLAEHHARCLQASNASEELLRLENLHAVLESRSKEALWLGDLDSALQRIRGVLAVDPCDSKALVEAGEVHIRRKEWRDAAQAYVAAATMGPPASALARHMAGLCFRELGDGALAGLLFAQALEIDPLGVSPRREMSRLNCDARVNLLNEWCGDAIPI